MSSYLRSLEAELREWKSARSSLESALSAASGVTASVFAVSNSLSGVYIGGNGIDAGQVIETKNYISIVKQNISAMISYCNEKIAELEILIQNEISRLNSCGTSANSTSTTFTDKPPVAIAHE